MKKAEYGSKVIKTESSGKKKASEIWDKPSPAVIKVPEGNWLPKGWIAVEYPEKEAVLILKKVKKSMEKLVHDQSVSTSSTRAVNECISIVDRYIKKEQKKSK